MKKDITAIFNKFAGKEIRVVEKTHTITIEGKAYTEARAELGQREPTVAAMKKLASDHGLTLSVLLPGQISTTDYRTDRINAHVEKDADGKYRIKKFGIG
jgi:hypothetical protein